MASAKPELPDLPAYEAGAQEHLDFANKALRRRENLIARVRKYGHASPMLVLVFENSDAVSLSASQHAYGPGLINQLISYDGQVPPQYVKPQWFLIYAALIRASDLWEADNIATELLGDVNAFLKHCLITNDQPALTRPDGHDEDPGGAIYRAVRDLQTLNLKRSGHPAEGAPVPLFWTDPPSWNGDRPVELWIPRHPLQVWLRFTHNRMSYLEVRNTLNSLGWIERHLQVRNPTDWRRRAHTRVWVVPVPWDGSEVDLVAVANVPTSPGGTKVITRARQEASHARNPGDAWGRWTGVGGTLRPPGDADVREPTP